MLWEAYLRSSQARTSRLFRDRRALAVLATCYVLLYLWCRPRLQQTARSLAARSVAARLGAPHAPLSAAGSFSGARARAAADRSALGGSDWEDLPALGDSEEPNANREGRVQLALYGAAPALRPWRTGRVAAAEDADAADAEAAHGQSSLEGTMAGHGGRRTGVRSAASLPRPGDLRGKKRSAAKPQRRRGAGAARVHVDIQRGASAALAQALRVRRAVGAERGGGGDAEDGPEPLGPEPPGEVLVFRQRIVPDRVHGGVRTRALRYEAFSLRVPRFPSAVDAAWFAGLPWVAGAARCQCRVPRRACAVRGAGGAGRQPRHQTLPQPRRQRPAAALCVLGAGSSRAARLTWSRTAAWRRLTRCTRTAAGTLVRAPARCWHTRPLIAHVVYAAIRAETLLRTRVPAPARC